VRGMAQPLIGALEPGALIIDTSTIHPSGAREFAVQARGRGLGWLDAPVSGGPSGAAAGTLAVMVGGQRADFDRAMPLFEIIGKVIVHFGGSGCGLVNKLANNTLLALSAVATCEMLVLVAKAGLDRRTALDVISAGSGYNKFMDTRGKILAQHGIYEPPAFTVNMLLKDLRIALDACGEIGYTPTALRTALAAFERAAQLGLGEQDFSSVLRVAEADAGVGRT
jgi:3-hydroxyisobutyrate dehydrogenase-like beta-hydroxyacid dehydrogenase